MSPTMSFLAVGFLAVCPLQLSAQASPERTREVSESLPPLPTGPLTCPVLIASAGPTFDMPPAIKHRQQALVGVQRLGELVDGAYQASIWLQIDTMGVVEAVEFNEETESPLLNRLLPRFAGGLRFYPATKAGRPVCVRLLYPFLIR